MKSVLGAGLLLGLLVLPCAASRAQPAARRATWTADNREGTFTNPLFYEEFSDPDMIKGSGMGEGSHFYKIDGRYYITSACWGGPMRLAAARADLPEGPYEVNPAVSIDEDFGLVKGHGLTKDNKITPADPSSRGRLSLHQGGIIRTAGGEWWGYSMMDYNSLGCLTALSPVTWRDG